MGIDPVVVIGGGVVGACCALQLQRAGRTVILVERNLPGDSTVQSSCSLIAVGEIIPLSRPGILRRAPGWLLHPAGPLRIRPHAAPGLIPWFARFAANGSAARVRLTAAHLAALTATAMDDTRALLASIGHDDLLGDAPVIALYDTDADFAGDRPWHDTRRAHGFAVDEISGAAAADLEPALAHDFKRAVVHRDWRVIADCRRLLTAITDAFRAGGNATVVRGEVVAFQKNRERVTGIILGNGDIIDAGAAVIAAGAWSKSLAAQVGAHIPLAAAAGYHTLARNPGVRLRHAVIYPAGGFTVTPCTEGLAIAGTVEFTRLGARPDYRRARVIARKAKRVLPRLNTAPGGESIGYRPLCPDTLPVIGPAPATTNVLIATGHGQLGLTLAATTAKLIAQLVARQTPAITLQPYRATRF